METENYEGELVFSSIPRIIRVGRTDKKTGERKVCETMVVNVPMNIHPLVNAGQTYIIKLIPVWKKIKDASEKQEIAKKEEFDLKQEIKMINNKWTQ